MTSLSRTLFFLLLALALPAAAGTIITSPINLNGTPFDASSAPALKTITYVNGTASDSFPVAYSYDGTNYYTLMTISGASQTTTLMLPAKWLAALNATAFTGTLTVASVFDNGASSVVATNQAINLPNTGGSGTGFDLNTLSGLTEILTLSYENGNHGNIYTGAPQDNVLLQSSPDNSHWTTMNAIAGGGCAVQGQAQIVQCYFAARYIRANYNTGSGQWPQPGGGNQATLRLQMGDKVIAAGSASSATVANGLSCPNGICYVGISSGPSVGLEITGIPVVSGNGLQLSLSGTNVTAGTGVGGSTLITSGPAFAAPGFAGSILIQPGSAVRSGNANGALVTIDASPGSGTLSAVNDTIAIGGQVGQTTSTTIGDATAEAVNIAVGTKALTITSTVATADAGFRNATSRQITRNTATPLACGASCSPTVAQLLDAAIITSSQAGTWTVTLPTAQGASGLVQALPGTPAVGDIFEFTLASNGTAGVIALIAGGGTTLFSPASLAGTPTWRVQCRVTSVTSGTELITCY